MLVHQLFDTHAAQAPERVALVLGEQSLTYGELFHRSEEIAVQLQAQGVIAGDLVGVFLDRSFDLIATFLGILKLGAAYVPLDTNYPADRIDFMVKDTRMRLIITSGSLISRIASASILMLDVEKTPHNTSERKVASYSASPEQRAYVMYTSGSTGTPKGVAIPHRGIVRLVQEPDFIQISKNDVFLLVSPVSFDASTLEIWGALTNGARLALMPPGQPSLQQIGEVIRKENVTVLWLTAGLFNLMVDERIHDLTPVKQLLAGGDVLSVPHIRKALAELPGTRLINGYGPTENTTFTCCYCIPPDLPASGSVPIGRPIRGTTVHVVDEQMREVADGQEGELITGGLGLALEYWNRPELTAERFITAKYLNDSNERFYRTGDYVRRRPDGEFEFLGRKDNQVKLRGFRIEMGDRSLVAWVVPKNQSEKPLDNLRQFASTRLPEHMRPGFWMWMDELPLNANGKMDRARLPDPITQEQKFPRELPINDLERLLIALWQELLGGRAVGVTDSYFEMGANSLLVAQAHERLRTRHGFELQLPDMFRFATVRSLSNHLQGVRGRSTEPVQSGPDRATLRAGALNRFKRK
jgi:aspartate racemase